MPTLAFLLMLAAPDGETLVTKPTSAAQCSPTATEVRGTKMAGPMTLGEQPPAAQVLTVFHRDSDGCPAPVVLRKGIGANPEKALPMARGGAVVPAR
ncbi:hypothetical protein ASE86_00410 [Sphingomonas sp. Leaf33]|nr:hypothetical protein ASE86_00410 [Sphingomonas sp. Leaf33]